MREYNRKETIRFLCEKLSIQKPQRYTQDWEIERADADRLREFIDFYIGNRLNENVKIVLMELIICSFDDKVSEGRYDVSDWNNIKTLLRKDILLHEKTIKYWAATEAVYPCMSNIGGTVSNDRTAFFSFVELSLQLK